MNEALSRLSAAGVTSPRRNVEWMLCEVLNVRRSALYARLDDSIMPGMAEQFHAMVERRRRHEPLQYILGYTEFFGMHLDVSPDVLIPRPETEQVVEEALRVLSDVDTPRILDIGTGSGCIALVIKRERPSGEVWAADISGKAIGVASKNAVRHGLAIQFLHADVFASDFSEKSPKGLDLLISNPPYIPEEEASTLPLEVRNHEPHIALVAPSDPLIFYRRIAILGKDLLKNGGHLILETHSEQGREAEGLLHYLGYEDVVLQRDYADRPRILRARHGVADYGS